METLHTEAQRQSQPHVSRLVSWFLVPTEELRLMTRRSTSFLSRILPAGVSSGMDLTPVTVQRNIEESSETSDTS